MAKEDQELKEVNLYLRSDIKEYIQSYSEPNLTDLSLDGVSVA